MYESTCTTGTDFHIGLRCKNCDTAIVCGPFGNIIREAKCSELTSNKTPYCDSEKHECVAANTCGNTVKMTCKYEGFFPNPMNCQKFIYCESNGMKPQYYDCPGNTRYDHAKQKCSVNIPCITFSSDNGLCQNKPYKFISYTGDPRIFTYCPRKGETSDIFTCNKENEIPDLDNWGACGFGCVSEGIFRDDLDDTKFYMCYKEGAVLKKAHMNCDQGTKFEANGKFCKFQTPLPTIKPPTELNPEGPM